MIPQLVPALGGGPDAYLDFDFRFGQERYWLNRQRYGEFGLIPGATSTGGGGFGQALRNGSWSGNLPNGTPLIGDGGLGVWEARTNSIRNPTALGAALPALPTNWGVGAPAGITITPVGRGVEGGLPYIDFQFSGTNNSGSTLFPNVTFEVTDVVCAAGETWTISCFGKLISGTLPGACALLMQQRASGAFVTNAGPAMSFGATLAETRGSAAMSATVNQVRPLASFTWPNLATATFVVRFAAPNLKLGPDINDPPILQASGLAATRTAGAIGVPQAPDTTQGTVIVEGNWPLVLTPSAIFAEPAQFGTANLSGFTLGAGGTGSAPRVIFRAGSNRIDCNGAASISPGSAFRMAVSWGGGSTIASAQGVTLTSTATPAQLDFNPAHQLSLGSRAGGLSHWINSGLIRRVTWDTYSVDQAALNARTAL